MAVGCGGSRRVTQAGAPGAAWPPPPFPLPGKAERTGLPPVVPATPPGRVRGSGRSLLSASLAGGEACRGEPAGLGGRSRAGGEVPPEVLGQAAGAAAPAVVSAGLPAGAVRSRGCGVARSGGPCAPPRAHTGVPSRRALVLASPAGACGVCLPAQPRPARLCPQRLRDPDRAEPPGHEGALSERVQLPRPLFQSECCPPRGRGRARGHGPGRPAVRRAGLVAA